MIACEQTGRICYTVELDENFCDVIASGAHVLWICDVWDGPYIYHEPIGKKRSLWLVAILDSYTRYIVHAEFYFNENRPCIEDTLFLKHHIPGIFYCDNARVFRSRHLKRIAAELGFSIVGGLC